MRARLTLLAAVGGVLLGLQVGVSQLIPSQTTDQPLIVKKSPPPTLPLRALIERLKGDCKVELTVSKEGSIKDVQVIASSGWQILDLAAAAAVFQWEFEPARKNGQPVAQRVRIPFQFIPPAEEELPGLRQKHESLKQKLPDDPVSFFKEQELFSKLKQLQVGRVNTWIDIVPMLHVRADWTILDVEIEKSSGDLRSDFLIAASIYEHWRLKEMSGYRKHLAQTEKTMSSELAAASAANPGFVTHKLRSPLRFKL